MKTKKINKRGQEEMIGFALIIIIVAVILLVFLAVSLNKSKKESLGTYETSSFVQATLSYTTSCGEDQNSYYSIQKLIIECDRSSGLCLDGRETCDVLNSTLKEILDESWKINENTPIKSYELFITSEQAELISLTKGNTTNNYKGAVQEFSSRGISIVIEFSAYY